MERNALMDPRRVHRLMLAYFCVVFIAIGAVLSGAITMFHNVETQAQQEKIKAAEKQAVLLQQTVIARNLSVVFSDLRFLARHNELKHVLAGLTPETCHDLCLEYLAFCTEKRIYDQIRYIDNAGMEVCRVNYNAGKPALVKGEDLQNKAGRYYFKDAIKLDRGQVFVSPLDLNIENGKIEQPLKPMIRFAMPVFDDTGKKRGIVILNYLAERLLNAVRSVGAVANGNVQLVNDRGYWLSYPNREREWGFMFPERSKLTFGNAFPDEWADISASSRTQELTPNGLFTSAAVSPLQEDVISSTGSAFATGSSAEVIDGSDYTWHIIYHVPPSVLNARSRGLLAKLFWMGAGLFLLSSIPAYFTARTFTERRLEKMRLHHKANYDALTDLPNRSLCMDRIGRALETANRYDHQCAVLFMDLDGFKPINDQFGHDAGDEALIQAARRFEKCVRTSDTVARMGGDEFVILMPEMRDPHDPVIIAQRVLDAMEAPFAIGAKEAQMGISIGICVHSGEEEDAESLLQKADEAMYDAKQLGKGRFVEYRPRS